MTEVCSVCATNESSGGELNFVCPQCGEEDEFQADGILLGKEE